MVVRHPSPYFRSTDNHCVSCTHLPECWRARKHLENPFRVLFKHACVPDGTRVVVSAFNNNNPDAEVRNNIALVRNGMAVFGDLRFVGKSGRGAKFHVLIRAETQPRHIVAIYRDAIKITVDGPRAPRSRIKLHSYSVSLMISSYLIVGFKSWFIEIKRLPQH